MNIITYLTIQQILMGVLIALGVHLIIGNVPKELKGSKIQTSGRIIGCGALIIPITSFIYYFSNLLDNGAQIATAINLTAYSLSITTLTLAYYILLDYTKNKNFIKIHLILGLIFPIPLWCCIIFGSEYIVAHIITASYTVFCITALIELASCIHLYRKRKTYYSLDENTTTMQKTELDIIGKTIYVLFFMVITSLLSPSFYSYPLWLGAIFVAILVGGDIYIYICYIKILHLNIESIVLASTQDIEAINNEEDLHKKNKNKIVGINDEIKSNIERKISEWLDNKMFLRPNVTIELTAKEIYTNRTYLSRYINATYNCSFKSWIVGLRIAEAKSIMIENPSIPITEIAQMTSFNTVDSFSHIFTRLEHKSPSRWRCDNIGNIESLMDE